MGQNLLDLKTWCAYLGFYAVSFSNIDAAMKIFSFLLFCGFTARRWWIMEKRNKDTEI